MKKQLLLLFFFLGFVMTSTWSQITFSEDPAVKRAIDSYKIKHKSKEMIDGWQIQFLYTNDRRELEETLEKIEDEFPQFEIIWTQRKPYYFVVGGAFEKEIEARRFLEEIKEEYPNALPVMAKLEPAEILNSF